MLFIGEEAVVDKKGSGNIHKYHIVLPYHAIHYKSSCLTMLGQDDLERVARGLLADAGFELLHSEQLQALWAGYGFIYAVEAKRIASDSIPSLPDGCLLGADGRIHLVLKIIWPPDTSSEEGHLRKLFSYEVEQYFYEVIAPSLPPGVAVAKCLASTRTFTPDLAGSMKNVTATLMTDLRGQFPIAGEKSSDLSTAQVYSAIKWLADFHGSSWSKQDYNTMDGLLLPPIEEMAARRSGEKLAPRSIWLNGGYTYLATRRTEYASLASSSDSEWPERFCDSAGGMSSIAEKVANFLAPKGRPFESFIHGDVKSENSFSTESGDSVAFFDFQYVGLGVGASDLAKLLTCSVPLQMLISMSASLPDNIAMQKEELELLKQYHQLLTQHDRGDGIKYDFSEFRRHWETALVDWCRFQASWGFWGNTRWLQGRVRSILCDDGWRGWLDLQE
ncbi:Protein kinase-like domain [Cordyceps militaris CM01]|uniref:Protein kinase-like domain n=1 Tax=Cordyceps militaris (strain CM01) TaxID=983644 RepID=G3JPV3_CORMM|nr:Protein kinase-like domain [Cordyceps militaris CM01]EGX89204.1 Protein kinase-like domain [Cordyceps militaris CM01]